MFTEKILCLGSNSDSTDKLVSELALAEKTTNYGLVASNEVTPLQPGFYHTTVIDMPTGGIMALAKKFDRILMLDQPVDQWTHWKLLLTTYRLMQHLEEKGHCVRYKDNANVQSYETFNKFLESNPSFCIYPWIDKVELNGKMNPCARSNYVVTTADKLDDWATDPAYQKIRSTMLEGKRLPDMCKTCYEYEDSGIESYRTFETREWVSKLGINTIDDLNKITHPYYYEVRLSNKCNLMCRGCKPEHSNSIEKEYKIHKIEYPKKQNWEYSSLSTIDKETLNSDVRVYITGGEPTVMIEVFDFMQDCIKMGKTDFDFTLGTNAAKISKKFLDLADHFSNLNFSVSLDGFGIVNDYWRWGSSWDTVIANTKELARRGHTISINCVPGIYNVTNLHLLFEFLDREFPFAGLYLQLNYDNWTSAFNHPNAKLVLDSMERCRNTRAYYIDGKSIKTCIDALIEHYSKDPQCDLTALAKFFEYNDQQDRARNVRLADYIPELEECRKLISVPTSTG